MHKLCPLRDINYDLAVVRFGASMMESTDGFRAFPESLL